MNVRYPVWLRTAQQHPGASVFAVLFALESIARGIVSTVITVQALDLLDSVRDVSLLFSAVGVIGLLASFSIPALVRLCSRRWIYTLGAALLVVSAIALATCTVSGQILGMFARVYGTACLNITLSLFILQYIRRSELVVSEPRRVQYSALAWVIGPGLGVMLYAHVGVAAPYIVSVVAAAALVTLFWALRLREVKAVQPARTPARGPWRSVGRFFCQPRMRLAWCIALVRSAWWVFFFIYAPAYAIEHGLGEMAGAMVISAGNALLFLAPSVARRAQRFGVRAVLIAGFLIGGIATAAAGLVQHLPLAVMVLLLVAAFGAMVLDAVGNIPFMAAVHPYEREAMTTVFRTYLDVSELLPPAVFALVLTFSDLSAVFLAQGVFMLVAIVAVWYLPARLGRGRVVTSVAASAPAANTAPGGVAGA